ncbi:MAG: DUF547 domain-containing protein [Saprospiraceae bacterium]|nr:DUF547 domain-containing protein [Saprospiraceae bacterium]
MVNPTVRSILLIGWMIWIPLLVSSCQPPSAPHSAMNSTSESPVFLSQDLLLAVKSETSTQALVEQIAQLDRMELIQALKDETDRLTFWLNVYNSYVQILLKENPELYERRAKFFSKKQIDVAGVQMSLDDIEHGMMRNSRSKYSLGYLGKMFPSKFEKALRVETVDWRIHFALNCGAASCPAIAFYESEALNEQLQLAAESYLSQEVDYDAGNNIVHVPALMSWFRADFGGKKGIRHILQDQGIVPSGQRPKIKFKAYNWNLDLDNYIE